MANIGAVSQVYTAGSSPLQKLIESKSGQGMSLAGTGGVKAAFPEYLQAARSASGVSPTGTIGSIQLNPGQEVANSIPDPSVQQVGFGNAIEMLIDSVAEKQSVAKTEVSKVLTGESDNLHQAMISMQESGLAFTMMVEVRNKLQDSLQEIMRMQI